MLLPWVVFATVAACTLLSDNAVSTSSDLQQALGEMPGVQQVFVSTGKTITVEVVLIENASAEQAAAVVRTFRNRTAEPGFRWREPQIEVRRGVDPSFFDVGVDNISLNLVRTSDFRAVSAAYRRLGREFTALSGARWRIGSATVAILGCTRRGYTPGAVEQKLADRYERC